MKKRDWLILGGVAVLLLATLLFTMPIFERAIYEPKESDTVRAKHELRDLLGADAERIQIAGVNADIGLILCEVAISPPVKKGLPEKGRSRSDIGAGVLEFPSSKSTMMIDLTVEPHRIMIGAVDAHNRALCEKQFGEWLTTGHLPGRR